MDNELTTNKNERLFLAGMVWSMFMWGLSWASGKVLSGYALPLEVAMFRFALTFLALLVMLKLKGENLEVNKTGWTYLLLAGLLMSAYNYLFFKGLTEGKAGAGGVLVTTLNPVIAYGISLTSARRWPDKREACGLLVGIAAGVVLLGLYKSTDTVLNSGNVYFLLASFTWSGLAVFTSKSSRYGSPLSFSLWMYGICFLMVAVLCNLPHSAEVLKLADGYFWGNLLFSGIITTALATTFYFMATAKIGASKASSFIFLVPFSAALGSWVFLDEAPQLSTLVGGSLGIVAVYILNKK